MYASSSLHPTRAPTPKRSRPHMCTHNTPLLLASDSPGRHDASTLAQLGDTQFDGSIVRVSERARSNTAKERAESGAKDGRGEAQGAISVKTVHQMRAKK